MATENRLDVTIGRGETGLDVANERLDAELAAKLDERRRVTIGQMADYDFPDLCRRVHACAMTQPRKEALPGWHPLAVEEPKPCPVCGLDTTLDEFCMPCVRVATRVICESVESTRRVHPGLFSGVLRAR